MVEHAHVKLSGDINGRYVVTDRRPGGKLTLVPDTSAEAIRERAGLLDPTPEQTEAFLARERAAHTPVRRRAVGSWAETEHRAGAHFDADAWEEDLARSTPGGRKAAEAARKDYETQRWIEIQQPLGLPHLSTGGMNRYRISEVEAWLRERYGSPSEAPQPRNR